MKRLRAAPSIKKALSISRTTYRSSHILAASTIRTRACTPHPSSSSLLSSSTPINYKPITNPQIRHASSSASTETLLKTPLYETHLAHGGKMVPFGGFYMPVQYTSLSVSASHHFTREHASLFDVSHMVQHYFSGPGVNAFFERITPMDVKGLGVGRGGLSVLLNGEGGIVDDTIVTRVGEGKLYVVTNAGCREKDLAYFKEELEKFKEGDREEVKWEVLEGRGLVALQGPESESILKGVVVDAEKENFGEWLFGQSRYVKVKGVEGELLVSRGGYTGEDGFEISVPADETTAVVEKLLDFAGKAKLQFAGLGARDSLRLEAGMCLYGHDLDETITPVEAALSWVIGKERREKGGFHGADKILQQLKPKSKGGLGVERRRIGLIIQGAPAREGAEIVNTEGEKIGVVTSGCPSPSLGKNIAMGYIKDGFHKSGTDVEVVVRGKKRKAQVTKMPFLPTKYWKGIAPA